MTEGVCRRQEKENEFSEDFRSLQESEGICRRYQRQDKDRSMRQTEEQSFYVEVEMSDGVDRVWWSISQ